MAALEVEVDERRAGEAELVFITVRGDVDLANADKLRGGIDQDRFAEIDGVVLDLRLVPFMDSSGLAAVLKASQELGPRLAVLYGAGSGVERLFDLTSAGDRISGVNSEEEAVATLTGADA